MSKKIVVFTVTGDQGGSVARYLLKDGGYEVVGVVRDPSSDKSKALEKLGVKLVKGDMTDPPSYASALEGAYGAFVNADFWAKYYSNGFNGEEAGEYEAKQSRDAITSAVKAGVKHIVYSTLGHTGYVPHMDKKAEVSAWCKKEGYPVTHLYTSHYISNLVKFGALSKEADGSLKLSTPTPDDAPMPNFAVEQTGGWVLAAFNTPDKYIGADIDACSEVITVKKWAEIISQATGKQCTTLGIGMDDFMNDKDKYQQVPELYLNYKAFADGKVGRDVDASKAIYPDQWDTKAWIAQSDEFKKLVA